MYTIEDESARIRSVEGAEERTRTRTRRRVGCSLARSFILGKLARSLVLRSALHYIAAQCRFAAPVGALALMRRVRWWGGVGAYHVTRAANQTRV